MNIFYVFSSINISLICEKKSVITQNLAFLSYFENIQHFSFAYSFIWVRKLDSDSLTETKNWSGRNEVIETSGRLHPLWPQNNWLRTPWTTDWIHTRQDRWIQTELAFTPAKNATKPNPFEIISLQNTRKKSNWKTEETLARAVVTVETERIKRSNSWCLWRRWWVIGIERNVCRCTFNLLAPEFYI
jgi:hypothetical protein